MLKILLQVSGWMLAHTPVFLLRFNAWLYGRVILLIPRRRRTIFSNLHHAFPEKSHEWRKRIALLSCTRLIETSLLSMASPFLSDKRIRRMTEVAPEIDAALRKHAESGKPLMLGTLHLAYWESLTWLSLLRPGLKETGVIFRPLANPTLNEWIKTTRERHGMRLLSRKTGLQDAFRTLRGGGIVSILFDQNAANQGALSLLLGRVCSTTELPGMLAEKFGAFVYVFYPRRTGFWRVRFEAAEIVSDGTTGGVTLALNRWLEKQLACDEDLCASWLWSHGRWRTQDWPAVRMRYFTKRNLLDEDLASRGLTRETMPRKTRFVITMPPNRDEAAIVEALLRRLRAARPDAGLTLLAEAGSGVAQAIGELSAADRIVELPADAVKRRDVLRELRDGFPDTHIVMTDSARADRDAAAIGATQRFGLAENGRRRRRLTLLATLPREGDPARPAPDPASRWDWWWQSLGLPPRE